MKKTLIIKSDPIKARACEIINALAIEPPHEVIIRPHKIDRSLAQNAYYWQIITIIGAELGYTKDDLHRQYKGQLAIPIMLKYPNDYQDFCSLVAEVQGLRAQGLTREADRISLLAVALVSTAKLKIGHMSEYIDDIIKHAAGLDIRLPSRGVEHEM